MPDPENDDLEPEPKHYVLNADSGEYETEDDTEGFTD